MLGYAGRHCNCQERVVVAQWVGSTQLFWWLAGVKCDALRHTALQASADTLYKPGGQLSRHFGSGSNAPNFAQQCIARVAMFLAAAAGDIVLGLLCWGKGQHMCEIQVIALAGVLAKSIYVVVCWGQSLPVVLASSSD